MKVEEGNEYGPERRLKHKKFEHYERFRNIGGMKIRKDAISESFPGTGIRHPRDYVCKKCTMYVEKGRFSTKMKRQYEF